MQNDLMPSPEEQIYLIKFLLESPHKFTGDKRPRSRNVAFKILYQLHLLQKNVDRGKWCCVYPSTETIAKWADVSQRSVIYFINSTAATCFFKVRRGINKSNKYFLNPWVHEMFELLERIGIMKNIKLNFETWKKTFFKRIENALIPEFHKGLSVNEVMNKLSTKVKVKLHPKKAAKLHPTTLSGNTTHSGFRYNSEEKQTQLYPALNDAINAAGLLGSRFKLQNGDINWLLKTQKLNDLKGGIRVADEWLKNGLLPQSPIRVMMSAIKKHKNLYSQKEKIYV
jgi:hypothetical protein